MSFTDTPNKADTLNNAHMVNQYMKNNQCGLLQRSCGKPIYNARNNTTLGRIMDVDYTVVWQTNIQC